MNIAVYEYVVESSFCINDYLFLEGDLVYLQSKSNKSPRIFNHKRECICKINRQYYSDIKDKLKEVT